MIQRSDNNTNIRVLPAENEGFIHGKKINVKQIFALCFLCLLFSCYVVNQSAYEQSSFDSILETSAEFSGERFVEADLSQARYNYKKYLELSHVSNRYQNTTSLETNNQIHFLNDTSLRNISRRNVFAELKDIERTPTNIFFLETRCATEKSVKDYLNNTGFILNARQCCAIESTAFMNFDRPVYVFHSCPISDNFFKYSPKFVERLFNYPNVHVVRLNTTELFFNSPLQDLYKRRLLETSLYPTEHTSDLIRMLVLWRFGGTYSDIDVVTIRSFKFLNYNWAGAQDAGTIANGVMNFEPEHDILQQALEFVNDHFDGSQWSSNGPLLITPIILKECKSASVEEAVKKCDGNFTIWLPPILYPIYYPAWEQFFREDTGRGVVQQVKKSAFSVHIWNKMSHDGVVRVGSTQAYSLLASEFCPEVYQNCGDTF